MPGSVNRGTDFRCRAYNLLRLKWPSGRQLIPAVARFQACVVLPRTRPMVRIPQPKRSTQLSYGPVIETVHSVTETVHVHFQSPKRFTFTFESVTETVHSTLVRGSDQSPVVRGRGWITVQSSGFRVQGSSNMGWGFGFRVSGFEFRVSCFVFRVSCFVFRVLGFGFRVSGFGFRVSGFGFRIRP